MVNIPPARQEFCRLSRAGKDVGYRLRMAVSSAEHPGLGCGLCAG